LCYQVDEDDGGERDCGDEVDEEGKRQTAAGSLGGEIPSGVKDSRDEDQEEGKGCHLGKGIFGEAASLDEPGVRLDVEGEIVLY
jgi:hypothetical protein